MASLSPRAWLAALPRGAGSMLVACTCFSLMATGVGVIHRLQPELPSIMTSTLRAGINLIFLLLISWRRPVRLWGDMRPSLWIRGILGAVSLMTYFGALARVGVGEAAFLVQTSTVWVALLAPWWLGEPTRRGIWLAVVGSLAGVWLLEASSAQTGPDPSTGRLLGALCGLISSGAYLSVRRASRTNAPETIVFYFTLMATLLGCALLVTQEVIWPRSPSIWALFVAVGLLATIAQLYMTRAYQEGEAARIAVIGQVGPVITTLLGIGILGERPDLWGWCGMALILLCSLGIPTERVGARET